MCVLYIYSDALHSQFLKIVSRRASKAAAGKCPPISLCAHNVFPSPTLRFLLVIKIPQWQQVNIKWSINRCPSPRAFRTRENSICRFVCEFLLRQSFAKQNIRQNVRQSLLLHARTISKEIMYLFYNPSFVPAQCVVCTLHVNWTQTHFSQIKTHKYYESVYRDRIIALHPHVTHSFTFSFERQDRPYFFC